MRDRCEDEIPLKRTGRQAAGRPKNAAEATEAADAERPHVPRVARLMALAIKLQEMIDRGEIADYAEIARLGFVTRARVTQIMNLLLLAPDIQEELLSLSTEAVGRSRVSERALRDVGSFVDWREQRKVWRGETQDTRGPRAPDCHAAKRTTRHHMAPFSA